MSAKMSKLFSICVMVFISTCLSVFAISGATTYEQQVLSQCAHTRFPKLCADHLRTLSTGRESENPTINLVEALIEKAISENSLPPSNFEAMSYHFISNDAQDTRNSIGECRELISMSAKRLNEALEAVKQSPEKNKEDIQTWISAALTYHQTCKDIVESQAVSNSYMAEIAKKMDYLSQLGSNPLALVNRIQEPNPKNRRLLEGGFPRWLSAKDRKLLQSSTINANAVVAKDGSGDYTTVSAAIQAAGGGGYVIYVKSGVYNEKIHCNKDGITLIGDGKYSTVISGSSSVGGGSSLQGSATVTISGDKFIAKDIGFQNTAGGGAQQAVALLTASDHSVFFRCSISGYQDTLYALSLRQFYRECDIYGTVDFVFGNAAAVFQNCYFTLRKHSAYAVILANGRTDPGQNTGFSLHNSKITGSSSNNYLGRPWKTYSRAVVMQCNIDGVISSRGWVEWPGSSGYAKTLYFAEYQNMGGGAGTGGRVQWPGYHVIAKDEATKFTVGNFIGGNSWLPSTGVSFVSGLS